MRRLEEDSDKPTYRSHEEQDGSPPRGRKGLRIRKCIVATVLLFGGVSLLVSAVGLLFLRCGARRQRPIKRVYKPAAVTRHPQEGRFLWMTPRSDGFNGFNNQLISVYEALRCGQKHNRTVVLPLIYENVRFDTGSRGDGPYPFEDYFDVRGLRAVVPYTTPALLDRTGVACSKIVYKPEINRKIKRPRPFPAHRLLREQYAARFRVALEANASLDARTDEACVDDSLCAHGSFVNAQEFGQYSRYDVSGQGYSVVRSVRFRTIRAAIRPGWTASAIAKNVVARIGGPFNAMHVRRGDFSTKCRLMRKLCARFGRNAFYQSRKHLIKKLAEFNDPALPVFISTTHEAECRKMLHGQNVVLFFLRDFYPPVSTIWAWHRVDIWSLASQISASQAEDFIGNRFSSYSAEITNMRLLRNSNITLKFF